MTGQIDIFKVTVTCFACRAPHGYNAEFLINGISEDSLTLNYETGKCTHQLGECRPGICSCSPSGNEFCRSFALKDTKTPVNFSCDMMFVDRITELRFSKYATVFYDGIGKTIELEKVPQHFVYFIILLFYHLTNQFTQRFNQNMYVLQQ